MSETNNEIFEYSDLSEKEKEKYDNIFLPGIDESEIIKMLKKIINKYPNFIYAQLNLAVALLEMGDTDEAKSIYENIISKDPKNASAIGGLSTIYLARNDLDEAEKFARQSIQLGYEWSGNYKVLGVFFESKGNHSEASIHFLRAYELNPHAWDNLESYCRLNNIDFIPPTEDYEVETIDDKQLEDLINYIQNRASTVNEKGEPRGCDHSLTLSKEWAEKNKIDLIGLYQFLNSHGAFCDCEVCYNIEE